MSELPDQPSWLALIRSPSEWQHAFGPAHAPVVVAGISAEIRSLVAAIAALGQATAPKCVIVEGGSGAGKSIAAAAFTAACQASDANVAFLNEGSDPDSVLRRVSLADALIIDNLDRFPAGLRRRLFLNRHAASAGTLFTVSALNALERELIVGDDHHEVLPRWEERPTDVLIIASLMWRDMGLAPDLQDICAEGVPEAFSRGPWPLGAHSINRFITLLADMLALEGYFERTIRPISVAEVLSALVAVLREQQPSERKKVIWIVVEGRTDANYLEAASRLALQEWGADLLSGFRLVPPGEGRTGGAEKAVRELIALEGQGEIAIGLLDDDEPGRSAFKDARRYTKNVHQLPWEFDALRNPKGAGKIEIEDLVSRSLIERFYEANSDLHPEETTTRGKLTRIVVAGTDKEKAASWVCENATFKDMEKLVYVLCMLRQSIGLPLPTACPALAEWIVELSKP